MNANEHEEGDSRWPGFISVYSRVLADKWGNREWTLMDTNGGIAGDQDSLACIRVYWRIKGETANGR